jgi:hypothetical protein
MTGTPGHQPHAASSTWTLGTGTPVQLTTISLGIDNGPVGRGGSGARYVTSTDGTKWIMKATFFGGQAHRYLYLNEALSAQVAWTLGVRTPDLAIMELSPEQLRTFSSTAPESSRYAIASRMIEPAEALSPDLVGEISPSERAGVTVLDAVVWNTDRNPEHLLVSRDDSRERRLWAIDHGHTFATADTIVGHLDPAAPMPPPPPAIAQRRPDPIGSIALDREGAAHKAEGFL